MTNNKILEKMASKKNIFGAVLCVESGDNTVSWIGSTGNIQNNDRYFITSVTKLCITTIVLKLRFENRVELHDEIYNYLPKQLIDGLHILNGEDHARDITVAHLLANTSGIPDYLSFKQANGKTADYNLFREGQDECWTLNKVIEAAKCLKPSFKPGQKGKVQYSNTNYRLLGTIIENIAGEKIGDIFQECIFDKLKLNNTYTYKDVNDESPVPMYYNGKELNIPYCMVSVTAEGGIVSTATETMKILKAFFNGCFFPKEYVDELKEWNFVFYPLQSYLGVGLEKLWVPRILSLSKPIKEILGFWGSSGAFGFYNPDTDLYITGTVNQSNGFAHGAAYKAMINIIKHGFQM